MGPKTVSAALEFFAELWIIVKFTVIGNYIAPRAILHGLAGGRREIDDCEPAMAQAAWSIEEQTFAVRPAMSDCRGHCTQRSLGRINAIKLQDSRDSAHKLVYAVPNTRSDAM